MSEESMTPYEEHRSRQRAIEASFVESIPDDADVSWESENGHTWWLVTSDGKRFVPPRWVYGLSAKDKRAGRNAVRNELRNLLEDERTTR